ncbi:exodeoxyribonuclease VII large subunit [Anaerolactibacter massiliensis]|jgi:exodeoxyribonuclease VII large subunit|uniref:exodeoxyribonuclease VII large subunit n=1 Tax=Anaerolactibacter massiliensis TaxID=2044573 RepID=UPI000CF9A15C|nr:exodeoxyribonuclease VII large subunit [Anaerolactibacter massiliensis]MDD6367545.1 exodeoxyribonuclease VII large subunit [Stecheria intestinalis]MDD7681002.1 exodeoxyribonuclease VII large subunit [Stecheria intestinalis]MDY4682453.1 exodeoxyribonuclease VII large subunit [Lachnospiraceae bacterium]
MSQRTVTVTALVRYLKSKLENDALIQGILVEGEISNFSAYRSGHWYFSIKDAGAQMRCVMFAGANRRMTWMPKDGDKVIVQADVSVYEGRGEMQLLVTGMKPAGIGDLFLQYEALKAKLAEEGLFDESHKKPIPPYPMRIALVTGKNTAARADVLNTLGRRWPIASIAEFPVLVQGTESAAQIIDALKKADTMGFDVILLVRGGGSIEDLWSFNDERLARTIYQLNTPIITGVGHEVDFTIADFVSDLRAPTPTGAAERCSPDIREVEASLSSLRSRLIVDMNHRMNKEQKALDSLSESPVFRNPMRLYTEPQLRLNTLSLEFRRLLNTVSYRLNQSLEDSRHALVLAAGQRISDAQLKLQETSQNLNHAAKADAVVQRERLNRDASLLDAYSPLKVLSRGYSITMKDQKAVRSAEELAPGDEVSVLLGTGSFRGTVEAVSEKEIDHGKEGNDI